MRDPLTRLFQRCWMETAGLAYDVQSDAPFLFRGGNRAYTEFFRPEPCALPSSDLPVCRVTLASTVAPELDPASKIFAAPPLYATHRSGLRRILTCDNANEIPPRRWTAVIDPEADRSTIHYGPSCLFSQPDGSLALATPFRHPLDQVFAMFRLARRTGLILHSCGFETAGRGIVLAGRSGAGKTTLARFLDPRSDVTVLSDDRTIVRRHENGWRVHGTPWPGDAGIARNRSAPLSALVFLTQADRNAIEPIPPAEALRRLLIVASVPWYDTEYMPPVLDTIDRLLAEVPCYEFRFRKDPSAADAIVDFARALV